jgi:hypothetical protein
VFLWRSEEGGSIRNYDPSIVYVVQATEFYIKQGRTRMGELLGGNIAPEVYLVYPTEILD